MRYNQNRDAKISFCFAINAIVFNTIQYNTI